MNCSKKFLTAVGKRRISGLVVWPVISMSVFVLLGFSWMLASELRTLKVTIANSKASETKGAPHSLTAEAEKITAFSKEILRLKNQIPDKGSGRASNLEQMRNSLQERRKLIEPLLEQDPLFAYSLLFPPSTIAQLPPEVKNEAEQFVSLDAKLEVIHIDDFQNHKATYRYFLHSGGERLEFYPIGKPSEISGATVRVKGFKVAEKILAQIGNETFQVLGSSPPINTIGDQKTLVVLLNFLDTPPPPLTPEEVYPLVFESTTQEFYQEASYGQISWSGDVIGPYTLPRDDGSPCRLPYFGGDYPNDQVYRLIRGDVDVREYQRLVLLYYHPSCGGDAGTVGMSTYPIEGADHRLSVAWIANNDASSQRVSPVGERPYRYLNFDYALIHELGHNLGALHASSWECGAGIILEGPQCQHIEYGNWFDVMGTSDFALHFNALYKDRFRWFNDKDLLTITESGTYTINTLEDAKGVKAAKIYQPGLGRAPYYLEYRRAIGFDATLDHPLLRANQDGLFINWILGTPSLPFSRLLDMTPTSATSDDWYNVALRGEQVFSDVANGVRIGPVLSRDASSITFRVEVFPPLQCIRRNPELTGLSTVPISITPGSERVLVYTMTNHDSLGCGPSNFRTDVVVPAGWTYRLVRSESILTPGAFRINDIYIRAPSSAVPGTYTVLVRATNLSSGLLFYAEVPVRFTIP